MRDAGVRATVESWEPLADHDRVPGDPAALRHLARRIGDIGRSAHTQATSLRRLESTSWHGEASEGFRETAGRLPVQLEALAERYGGVGVALNRYSHQLETAQTAARSALAAARRAQESQRAAALGVARMREHYASEATRSASEAPGAATAPVQPWVGPDHSALLGQADDDMAAARRRFDEAVSENACAAGTCAAVISREADNEALRNPGGGWGASARVTAWAREVSVWAGNASAVLSIAAVALCWVPGLNAVLATLALVTGAMALSADYWLFRRGEKDRSDLAWSAAGVVAGGAGKVLGGAAMAVHSARFARASVRLDAARSAVVALGRQRRAYVAGVSTTRGLASAPVHAARAVSARGAAVAAASRASAVRADDAFSHMPWTGVVTASRGAAGVIVAPFQPVRSVGRARDTVRTLARDFAQRSGPYGSELAAARAQNGLPGVLYLQGSIATDLAGAAIGGRTLHPYAREAARGLVPDPRSATVPTPALKPPPTRLAPALR